MEHAQGGVSICHPPTHCPVTDPSPWQGKGQSCRRFLVCSCGVPIPERYDISDVHGPSSRANGWRLHAANDEQYLRGLFVQRVSTPVKTNTLL